MVAKLTACWLSLHSLIVQRRRVFFLLHEHLFQLRDLLLRLVVVSLKKFAGSVLKFFVHLSRCKAFDHVESSVHAQQITDARVAAKLIRVLLVELEQTAESLDHIDGQV